MRQLQQPDLLEDVAGALDASGLDPGELMLEITESVLAADQEAMLERLGGLRALGVHLAIDDFGTGYSALAYLRSLPVDTLKLAKPFVDGLLLGVEEAALTNAILRIADLLDILAKRAMDLGADVRFECEVEDLSGFADAALIVANDKVRSRIQAKLQSGLAPSNAAP